MTMTGYIFKTEKTILYGRKCSKCGRQSHKGDFYTNHHWYCDVCRPMDDYAVSPIMKEIKKGKELKIQADKDADYKKQLRMHKLQIPMELVYE